jgi:glyoxylase-like metal-dependent hydrolase (beta-lactamase superfamily II)
VIAIDYGYHTAKGIAPNIKSTPYSRRPLLHSIDELEQVTGKRGIDVVVVSHYHDDHVVAIPLLQRVFQTECWVPENFADLLANPQDYTFPCTWPAPIQVHRRLQLNQTATIDDVTFHFAPMSGHTRFSALIGFELDGVRYAHTGDQYFPEDFRVEQRPWEANRLTPNHVYKNGAFLNSFRESARWLREWQPEVLLTGHMPACRLTPAFFERLDERTEVYERLHQQAMPLGEAEAHFEVDSWGGWIRPYRRFVAKPAPIPFQVTVRNPLPHAAMLNLRLVGPSGWVGASASLQAAARAEVSCQLSITPAGECRRQAIAVELEAEGQPFGQVAEALVTVGGSRF